MVAQKASLSDQEAGLEKFSDRKWRINSLYTIKDKEGVVVPFVMNDEQDHQYHNMHYLNIILKARQLGFSTFILIFMLDMCLFNSNTKAGIIDCTLEDAQEKLNKIKFAYSALPEGLKAQITIVKSNETMIEFSNGSGIKVGTSHRGGTLQILHISEFGKICAKTPEKAREIVTGALNTIAAGQLCFIESTAEGQEGRFYEMCQTAQEKQRRGDKLTEIDFKFHFYPWHGRSEYQLDPENVIITDNLERYFEKLSANENIQLTPAQKAWYVKKAEVMFDDMKREYPSTPEEAFEASVEGAILGEWLEAADLEGRIGNFPAIEGLPVHSFFDIGRRDYTSIWFVQFPIGGRPRVIHFYQNCMAGMPHYADYCKALYLNNGWLRGDDIFPHDAKVIEWGSDRSRIEQLKAAGFNAKIGTELSLHDGINACRAVIPLCEFDQAGCAEGLKVLRNYRWEWDEKRGCWRTGTPSHDINSHGSDAFRTFATSWREIVPSIAPPKPQTELKYQADEHGRLHSNMSVMEIVRSKERRKRRD